MSRCRPVTRLFVYGSLRPGSPHPMARWLARRSRLLGPAWLPGRLYALPGYPALVDASGARVRGELLALARPLAVLAELDRYEAAGPAVPNPEFRRVPRPVQAEGLGEVTAWVYLYARPVAGLRPLVTQEWLPKSMKISLMRERFRNRPGGRQPF